MFNLFNPKPLTAAQFWVWFDSYKYAVENFIDSDMSDRSVLHQVTKKLKQYNELLFPEFTKNEANQYVLIITPDGLKDGVKPTQDLVAEAITIDQWVVEKFRQPKDHIEFGMNDVQFPSSDIEILATIREDENVVDINIFIRGMNINADGYKQLAFLYMDHIIGEFNSITRVGIIDFHHLDINQSVKESISLQELRKLIEDHLY